MPELGNCETNLKLECDEEKTNLSGFSKIAVKR